MAFIEETFEKDVISDLKKMKFIDPKKPEKEIKAELDDLAERIENKIRNLLHG